jgi:hypothetical protein
MRAIRRLGQESMASIGAYRPEAAANGCGRSAIPVACCISDDVVIAAANRMGLLIPNRT